MAVVVRALAVSDEEVSHLRVGRAAAPGVDLVIAAGDLAFEYLGALIDLVDRPGVFVPGNHDPDVSGFSKHASLSLRAGTPKDWPELAGFVNADGRVVDVGGRRRSVTSASGSSDSSDVLAPDDTRDSRTRDSRTRRQPDSRQPDS